jgi:GH35 family endo-1,4-beta-xylanase
MARLHVLALLASAALAETSLLPEDPLRGFTYSGPTSGERSGRAEIVPVDGMPFSQAWRLITSSLPPSGWNEWDLRIRARGASAVKKGDTIVVEFWLRCLEPAGGECVTKLNVERADAPYTKSVNLPYLAGGEWQQYRVLFRMAEDYGAGGYYLDFWMGQQVQQAEIGGIRAVNHGPGVRPEDVGIDPLYDGAAPEAPWRAEAEARIDSLRKAALTVRVVDSAGKPVEGAEVQARMTRHAFGWGTAVAAGQLLAATADAQQYRRLLLENFNFAVLENDLKWPQWEQNRQRALNGIQWLRDNGITRIRGHNLVWPGWTYLPQDVRGLASQPEALRNRVRDHIRDIVAATRGLLEDWDVLNEPFTNRDLQAILGDAEMAAWFQIAKESDPEARLFVNDYNILSANGADLRHRNGFYSVVQYLRDNGAPVEGIGLQGHFTSATPPVIMLRILDRFAAFGLPIEITEYDFTGGAEELQAQFTRDLLTVVFSHPAVSNFLMWGFWEGRHWRPEGAMIRRDWSSKPMHHAWREMIYDRWWTNATGATSAEGAFTTRGFKGDYRIEVKMGERTQAVNATLHDDAQVRIILE